MRMASMSVTRNTPRSASGAATKACRTPPADATTTASRTASLARITASISAGSTRTPLILICRSAHDRRNAACRRRRTGPGRRCGIRGCQGWPGRHACGRQPTCPPATRRARCGARAAPTRQPRHPAPAHQRASPSAAHGLPLAERPDRQHRLVRRQASGHDPLGDPRRLGRAQAVREFATLGQPLPPAQVIGVRHAGGARPHGAHARERGGGAVDRQQAAEHRSRQGQRLGPPGRAQAQDAARAVGAQAGNQQRRAAHQARYRHGGAGAALRPVGGEHPGARFDPHAVDVVRGPMQDAAVREVSTIPFGRPELPERVMHHAGRIRIVAGRIRTLAGRRGAIGHVQ